MEKKSKSEMCKLAAQQIWKAFLKQPLGKKILVILDIILYTVGFVMAIYCVAVRAETIIGSIDLFILGVAGIIGMLLTYKQTKKSSITNGIVSVGIILLGIINLIISKLL